MPLRYGARELLPLIYVMFYRNSHGFRDN